jgi:type IX secretion system PorP/SprF family membrane protein
MKTLFSTLFFFCIFCLCNAQQDPLYSLYLNNPFVINPAYAGINNLLYTQFAYRTQWVGLGGNPTTMNFSGHTSVYDNKGGIGLQVLQDRIGENKNTEAQAAFSYKLNFSRSTLSFGMQAGLMNFSNSPDDLTIRDGGDPNFASYSQFTFNMGAGVMLKSDRYFVGLSAPRMLPAKIQNGGTDFQVYHQALYLTGAYMFILSSDVSFKPTVLLRGTKNAPVSTDLHANFSFRHAYGLGVFTRNLNSYGVSAGLQYNKLQFAYLFEIPTNRSVGPRFISHEVMVSFKTGVFQFQDARVVSSF